MPLYPSEQTPTPPNRVEARTLSPSVSAFTAFACYFLCCLSFIWGVTRVRDYWEMSRTHGDNPAYLAIAQAAVEGRFSGPDLQSVRQFYRGTGYCIALASLLTGASVSHCLPILGLICGALAVYFCGRLWGWTVAALFSMIGVEYTPQVCQGSCEPFFVLFLFVSLWLWRRQQIAAAFIFAALATTVRPTGILLIVALAGALAWHHQWRDLGWGTAVASVIGALYLIPQVLLEKDAWAPVNGYAFDWYGASPVTVPFYPLVRAGLANQSPWTNDLKICFYISLTVFGLVILCLRRREAFAEVAGQAEWAFFILFAAFCVSYNSHAAYEAYSRYSVPIIPQSIVGLRGRFLSAGVILPLSIVAGLVSAAGALNVRTVYHMLLH